MVLRWRPNCRAICAWLSPCLRPAESIYLSSEVSWWYVIVVSLVLADGRNRKYSSAPHLGARVLHLLYEFAPPNPAVNADARWRGFARAAVAGYLGSLGRYTRRIRHARVQLVLG